MNLYKSIRTGLVILFILQAVILTGCAQYEELTNDPPEITTFTIPNEVEYGETVEFRARVFDPEDDSIEVCVGGNRWHFGGRSGPPRSVDCSRTAAGGDCPAESRNRLSLRTRWRRGRVSTKRQRLLSSPSPIKLRNSSAVPIRSSPNRSQGDPVAETSTLRLTSTTFTREIQSNPEAEVQAPTQFITGTYRFIEPFDESSGTIHWFPTGSTSPDVSTYTWDSRLLVVFYPETATSLIYEK